MPTNDYLPYLQHHGILGMKWGVRRYQNEDGSLTSAGQKRYSTRQAKRYAKKDAKEYARAKMFYGKGAGNRRKLIKAKVTERSKDATYKKEFEERFSKQDMAKHSDKARRERKRKDIKETTTKTARGVAHTVLATGAKTTAAAAVIGTAAVTAHKYGIDKLIWNYGKQAVSKIGR